MALARADTQDVLGVRRQKAIVDNVLNKVDALVVLIVVTRRHDLGDDPAAVLVGGH